MAKLMTLQNKLKSRSLVILFIFGTLTGIFTQLNRLAYSPDNLIISNTEIIIKLLISSLIGFFILSGLNKMMRYLVLRLHISEQVKQKYLKYDTLTCGIFLVTVLGSVGIKFTTMIVILIFISFLILQIFLLYFCMTPQEKEKIFISYGWLSFLFLLSGFAALIYQIAWQRLLFAIFGTNVESVTIIVSIFMFGLGVGSVIGGLASKNFNRKLPELFFICEIFIAIFGSVSIPLIKTVGASTLHNSLPTTTLIIYLLLCIPTMLMGATLPILVAYLHQHYKNIGKSVGILYSVNTAGSAIACFFTIEVLFRWVGIQSAVYTAAICNLCTGLLVYTYAKNLKNQQGTVL